jgi:hypothetical protein
VLNFRNVINAPPEDYQRADEAAQADGGELVAASRTIIEVFSGKEPFVSQLT